MSKKNLTAQQQLFHVKQQEIKSIVDDNLARKQLESWDRWVLSRVIYRKLKPNPPDWFEWLEKQLKNTHYTLTQETFNKIIKLYTSLNL